ncbi:MAG: hypothetical protein O3A47_13600 [Chloroflexi bacterium]|nr:hypothetical protein [Chloroflexota bacterium]
MSGELHVVEAERPRWFARLGFLYFIEELSPETWDTLREDVLPLYERFNSRANSYAYAFASEEGKAEIVAQRATEYAVAMQKWQERWNFHDDWLIEESAMVLHLWATYGYDESLFVMGVIQRNLDSLKAENETVEALGISPFTVGADAWNPTRERWFDYQKRTLEQVKEALADYRSGIEELPSLAKWTKKRPRADRGAEQHLKWLVRFQVLGEPQQDIADDPTGDGEGRRVEVRSVQDAIRITADLIGLTRRSIASHE